MRVSLSTPAGTLTRILCSRVTRVSPWQVLQGLRMTVPVPLQTGQVRATEKKPCCERIWPRPPHCWQVSGCLPPSEPVPRAVFAGLGAADGDLALDAEDGFFELEPHVELEVAAALLAGGAAAARRPC